MENKWDNKKPKKAGLYFFCSPNSKLGIHYLSIHIVEINMPYDDNALYFSFYDKRKFRFNNELVDKISLDDFCFDNSSWIEITIPEIDNI